MNNCLNCGTEIKGKFCPSCGQKDIENRDRSIGRLVIDLFNNIFFFDNRFWVSIRYMVTRPGVMTVEFLNGKRRKFIPPITLFLFINVIYFFLSPLTDYALPLYDQMNYQPYSSWSTQIINKKLEAEGLELEKYTGVYNRVTNDISQSLMILNVPLIALFIYIVTFRKRKYYFDSLIYSLHYFSLFLLSICAGDILENILAPITRWLNVSSWGVWVFIFVLLIPVVYAIFSIKKYLDMKWSVSIIGGLWVFIAGALAQFIYRGIIFIITFWAT